MPALDAINIGRPDLPACDDPAQERPLRRNGKKIDQWKVDFELAQHLVERQFDASRCGYRRVLLSIGGEDRNRVAIVVQLVGAVIAGHLDFEPVGSAHDDLYGMEDVKRL